MVQLDNARCNVIDSVIKANSYGRTRRNHFILWNVSAYDALHRLVKVADTDRVPPHAAINLNRRLC